MIGLISKDTTRSGSDARMRKHARLMGTRLKFQSTQRIGSLAKCSAEAYRGTGKLDRINLQHLVAVVVDHLDRDLAGGRWSEGAAGGGVEIQPGGLVDFCPKRALELVVWLVGAGEVG